jgi:hypothetical protein
MRMRTRFRPCWPLISIAVLFAASVVVTFVGCGLGGMSTTKPSGGYDPPPQDPEYDGEILFSDNFQEYEGIDPSKWVVHGEGAAIDGQYLTVTADEPWETGVESVMAFGRPSAEEFVAIDVYTKFLPDSHPSVGICSIQEEWGQGDGDSYFVRFENDHGYPGRSWIYVGHQVDGEVVFETLADTIPTTAYPGGYKLNSMRVALLQSGCRIGYHIDSPEYTTDLGAFEPRICLHGSEGTFNWSQVRVTHYRPAEVCEYSVAPVGSR